MNQESDAREKWLENRRTGIGGSDIGAIMGLSKFKTAYDVYLDKTGQSEKVDNAAMHWGTILEDVVAKEYANVEGRKVQRVNQMLRHSEHDFCVANIDRAVINPDIAKIVRWKDGRLTTDRILECKTANGFKTKMWGEAGTDYVPESYLAQVQWYMFVTHAKLADLAVLIGGQDFRVYHIERDDALIEMMFDAANTFWTNLKNGIAPAPETVDAASKCWKQSNAEKTIAVDSLSADFDELAEINEQQKTLKQQEDAIKARIMTHMQDAESATINGITVCTWKTQTSRRLDSKALKEAHPDLYKAFTKESTSRRFLIK